MAAAPTRDTRDPQNPSENSESQNPVSRKFSAVRSCSNFSIKMTCFFVADLRASEFTERIY